jgi:uncharacterized lipoprotein YmbA
MIQKVLFCLIFIVIGCSSAPKPEIQHFLLTPNIQATNTDKPNSLQNGLKNIMVLDSINLAEFLDQSGIVLQKNAHQIEVAHYNRWGEPLKHNLHRYILETLTTQLPQLSLLSENKINSGLAHQKLEITFNQFNGTIDGLALLSGHWMLKQSDAKTYMLNNSFSYQTTLENSGYPELVKQLANLLDQLCNELAMTINNT